MLRRHLVSAVFISVMLFDEQATPQLLIGVSLILAGVILDIVSGGRKETGLNPESALAHEL